MTSHFFIFVETSINFFIREFINFIREIMHTTVNKKWITVKLIASGRPI